MLKFIYSTVNSGKSANLIMRAHSCFERNIEYRVLVPYIASARDSISKVASRVGFTQEAYSLREDECPFTWIENQSAVKVVFVDEAQFLSRSQVLGLTKIVDRLQIPVFAYGLRTDFKGEPFEGSTYLMAWSDEIETIGTFCVESEVAVRATFNMKIDEFGKQITEGNSIDPGFGYAPISRKRFLLK